MSDWIEGVVGRLQSTAFHSRRSRLSRSVESLEGRVVLSVANAQNALALPRWFEHVAANPAPGATQLGGQSTGSVGFVGPIYQREFLVRLTPDATAQAGSVAGSQALLANSNVSLTVVAGLGLPGQLLVTTSERDTVKVVTALQANLHVAHFEEDYSVGASAQVFPNEQTQSSLFTKQYGLHNIGQDGGTPDADIDAPEAWSITTGSAQVVVSVIDSGVDFTHPDLYLNIWLNQAEIPSLLRARLTDADADGQISFRDLNAASNASFVSDLNHTGYIDAADLLDDPLWSDGIDTDNNGFEDDLVGWDFQENDNKPFDEHGHGTHVAGILGASGNNGIGVAGVNWTTSILPLRFLDQNNTGDLSDAIEAINYQTMLRNRERSPANIRVSNNSWGISGSLSQNLFDAVQATSAADILFVAAAGNGDVLGHGIDNDTTPFYPANINLPNVISVGAFGPDGSLARFSNFGDQSVDIAAPGVGIVSTSLGENYISRNGTSMATPFVTGTAALVFSVRPNATADEVRDAIFTGADHSDSLANRVANGRRLNARGALTASTFAPVPALAGVTNITASGGSQVSLIVTYTDDEGVDLTSIDAGDLEISRIGFASTRLTATAVSTEGNATRRTATYQVPALGGSWDATDSGTYVVHLRTEELADINGVRNATRELGRFMVAINDPSVFIVNTTLDTVDADLTDNRPLDTQGRTSLRAAIMQANATVGPNTIVVADGIYSLTIPGVSEDQARSGDLDVTGPLTLVGAHARDAIIDAVSLDRVLDLQPNTIVTIHGLTLRGGLSDEGGGLRSQAASATIEQVRILLNTATRDGGGLHNSGTLQVIDTTFDGNRTTSPSGYGGGGLFNRGTAIIERSTFSNNDSAAGLLANRGGGGVYNFPAGNLTATNDTFSGNRALRGDGGAIFNAGTAALTHLTIADNEAKSGFGGGVYNVPPATVPLEFQSAFGTNGPPPAYFSPGGLSKVITDSTGRIITLDYRLGRVQVFDNSGRFLFTFGRFGKGDGEFASLDGIVTDSSDAIFVLDGSERRIQKFDQDGHFVRSITLPPSGSSSGYTSLAIDSSNRLFVSKLFQGFGGSIVILTASGEVENVLPYPASVSDGTDESRIVRIAVDSLGRIFLITGRQPFVDGEFVPNPDAIVVIDQEGQKLFSIADRVSQNELSPHGPYDVAFDASGNIYVGDELVVSNGPGGTLSNGRIDVYSPSGVFIRSISPETNPGVDRLLFTQAIFVGTSQRLYVAESPGVRVLDLEGQQIAKFGTLAFDPYPSKRRIDADGIGNIYVSDQEFHRVQVFDSNRQLVRQFGREGTGNGEFETPTAVAVSSTGMIYVADSGNHRIQQFDSSGNFIRQFGGFGTTNGLLSSPQGIVVNSVGELFVVDATGRLQVFSSTGQFQRVAVNGLSGASDIAIDVAGRIIVSESSANRIRAFNQNGQQVASIGPTLATGVTLSSPISVATDSLGNVYVANQFSNRVDVLGSNFAYRYSFGSSGNEVGQFNSLLGVAVASNGHVVVSDRFNDRVQEFAPPLFAGGTLAIRNTIISGNRQSTSSTDLVGPTTTSSSLISMNVGLAPLADNGGFTNTRLPLPGSVAVDAGNSLFSPATDQLGRSRSADGNGDGTSQPDIGAAELATGQILGTVYVDANNNGIRDPGESGLRGVSVYIDLNINRRFDMGEPTAMTSDDNVTTPGDESGTYVFGAVRPGNYAVRINSQLGYAGVQPLVVASNEIVHPSSFRRVARTGDAVPNSPNHFFEFLGTPSIRDGRIAFNDSGLGAVFIGMDTDIHPVIERGQVLPKLRGAYSSPTNGTLFLTSDGVVMTAASDQGVYGVVTISESGEITPIAVDGDDVPAGIGQFSFTLLSAVSDGLYAFRANAPLNQDGYYLGTNEGIVVPLDTNHSKPSGTLRLSFADDLAIDGSHILFVESDGIGSVSLRDPKSVEILAGTAAIPGHETLIPGSSGFFTRFGITYTYADGSFNGASLIRPSNGTIAFLASGDGGRDGIYLRLADGSLQRVADRNTPIPGGTGTFQRFGFELANSNGRVAFVGTGADDQEGIYLYADGQLFNVVDTNDVLSGQHPHGFGITSQALDGIELAFSANLSDVEGSTSIFDPTAIYLADLNLESRYDVTVASGRNLTDRDFGLEPLDGGIQGFVFRDTDGDGIRAAGEVGVPGQTVFIDQNRNGLLDSGETSVSTTDDGVFQFAGLASLTSYAIGMISTNGFSQTFPVAPAQRLVTVAPGNTQTGVVFGVQSSVELGGAGANGSISGVIYQDSDEDGVRDSGEVGIAGVTVFVDENGDRVLNGGERSAVTGVGGAYTVDQLRGNRQAVRVVVPAGVRQINPLGNTFTKSTVQTTDSPVEVVVGDLDRDGDDDMIASSDFADEVQVFLNAGNGSFGTATRVSVPSGPGSLAVGKFRGSNQAPGVVVGHRISNNVTVLTRQVNGSFTSQSLVTPAQTAVGQPLAALGSAPYFVTTGDFDGDGDDDIAVASQNALPNGGAVVTFLSDGNGGFTREQLLTLPRANADSPTAITAARVDGDARVDLVLANLVSNNVTVLNNTGVAGTGRFSIASHLAVGGLRPTSVQVGDLNGDGRPDLATTNFGSNNISVLLARAAGGFDPAVQLNAGRGPADLELVDVDRNGSLDIVFTNSDAANRFGILRNRGAGVFQAAETSGLATLPDGTLAFALAVGQFNDDNGDGVVSTLDIPDVAVTNRRDGSVGSASGSITVGLDSIVAGALNVELTVGQRTASGLDFALRAFNQLPTLNAITNPVPIDEDAAQQMIVASGITDGGDPTAQALRVTVVSSVPSLFSQLSASAVTNGNSTLIYKPALNRNGTATITVTVRDAGLDQTLDTADDGLATRSFDVTVRAVNDLPTAMNDTANAVFGAGAIDVDVIANDDAANPDASETLRVLAVLPPVAGGTVSILPDKRRVRFTPPAGATGQHVLHYVMSDGNETSEADLTVSVNKVEVLVNAGNDNITVQSVAGAVRVLRNNVIDNAASGAVSAQVATVRVTGGTGANQIDLSGVTRVAFSLATGVTVSADGGSGNDTLIGSEFGDSLSGDVGDDQLTGGLGADTLDGGTGTSDVIAETSTGTLTLTSTKFSVVISGVTESDTLSNIERANISGSTAANKIDLSGFAVSTGTTINGAGGSDTIIGSPGPDMIFTLSGADSISGLGGADMISSGSGNDTLSGGDGVDNLNGQTGNDLISGDAGNDVLVGGAGVDTLNGGADNDFLSGQTEAGLLNGGDGNDVLQGNASNDTLNGDAGDDRLLGLQGDDVMSGGNGIDLFFGGAGNDTLSGGPGADDLRGEGGDDSMDGGADADRVIELLDTNVTITGTTTASSITTASLGVDKITNVERINLMGGAAANFFDARTANFPMQLAGDAGNDTLLGGSKGDLVTGGEGDDVLSGGAGNDVIDGGNGTDYVYEKADTNFTVNGVTITSSITGTDTPTNIERIVLVGGVGANKLDASLATVSVVLIGGRGNDTLLGGNAADTLSGGNRNDATVVGGDGADTLDGGNGNDTLESNPSDTLILGSGDTSIADVFTLLPSWIDML